MVSALFNNLQNNLKTICLVSELITIKPECYNGGVIPPGVNITQPLPLPLGSWRAVRYSFILRQAFPRSFVGGFSWVHMGSTLVVDLPNDPGSPGEHPKWWTFPGTTPFWSFCLPFYLEVAPGSLGSLWVRLATSWLARLVSQLIWFVPQLIWFVSQLISGSSSSQKGSSKLRPASASLHMGTLQRHPASASSSP